MSEPQEKQPMEPRIDPDKLKKILEAALLAADEPLSVDQLVKLFKRGEVDRETIRADVRDALNTLTGEAEERGYELKRVASGYRYQVRQELSLWISRLWEEKPPRYTRALLETLALVAYKQPVTRGDIEQVRGVSVSQNIMRTLLERGWIRVVGQREVPGRPAMYGTTRAFLDYFNLKSLGELPPLAEIRELIEPLVVEEAAAVEAADLEAASVDAAVLEAGEAEAAEVETDEVEAAEVEAAEVEAAEVEAAEVEGITLEEVAAGGPSASVEEVEQPPQVVDVASLDDAEELEPKKPTADVVQLPTSQH
jgi:segregation and condensation protein B